MSASLGSQPWEKSFQEVSAVDINEHLLNLTSAPTIQSMHRRHFEESAKSKIAEKKT